MCYRVPCKMLKNAPRKAWNLFVLSKITLQTCGLERDATACRIRNGKIVRTQFPDDSFIIMTSAISHRQWIIRISIISKLSIYFLFSFLFWNLRCFMKQKEKFESLGSFHVRNYESALASTIMGLWFDKLLMSSHRISIKLLEFAK